MKFLPFLILVSCLSSSEKAPYTTEQKYDILEKVILDTANTLFDYPLIFSDMSHLGPPSFIGSYESELAYLTELLNIQDSTYLLEQFKERKNFDRTNLSNPNIQVLSISQMNLKNFWDYLDSDSIDGVYSIEFPIFNDDQTKFYIRTGYTCGSLCGSGEANLFEYNNATGNWEISEILAVEIN